MKKVSSHACDQYAKRILSIDKPLERTEQYQHIRKMILDDITDAHANVFAIGTGEFKTSTCTVCLANGIVTTIKEINNPNRSKVSGGIMKSGKKIKKKMKSEAGPREHIIPEYAR